MQRGALFLLGLSFLGFGVAFLAAPDAMAALIDVSLNSSTARADVRAVYGGMEVGVGGFLLACARREGTVTTGLWAALAIFAALACGRAVGIAADAEATGMTLRLLASELAAAAVAGGALFAGRRDRARG